ARTDAAASEGMEGAIARAQAYVRAGADAIFPEALTSTEMFREFTRRMDCPVLANMTEFGRTPQLTLDQFRDLGCRMVIWPVSSLRMAARAQEELYAELARHGSVQGLLPRMQTRSELYATIGYHDFEALDASIVSSIAPDRAPEAERK